MVSLRKSTLLTAASLATSRAATTLAETDEEVQMLELAVYVEDIAANMAQYLSFRQQNPDQPYPTILNTVVLEAVGSDDESWTTALTGIDPSTVWEMLTGVPWYSTRILPALTSRFGEEGIVVSGINEDAAVTTATAATTTAATTAATTTSAAATTSSTEETSATTTAADATTSSTEETSATPTTSSTSSTVSIEQATNAGQRVVAGLGAGVLAAAALLI